MRELVHDSGNTNIQRESLGTFVKNMAALTRPHGAGNSLPPSLVDAGIGSWSLPGVLRVR